MLRPRSSMAIGGHLHVAATRVYHAREGTVGLQVKEESLCLKQASRQ